MQMKMEMQAEQTVTQDHVILKHLQTGGSITGFEALNNFGIYRLSAVIYKLRKRGYNIKSEMVHVKTRYGRGKVARYSLVPNVEPW
jgi:hypothetical protein